MFNSSIIFPSHRRFRPYTALHCPIKHVALVDTSSIKLNNRWHRFSYLSSWVSITSHPHRRFAESRYYFSTSRKLKRARNGVGLLGALTEAVCLSVCPARVCLEHSIFILLPQAALSYLFANSSLSEYTSDGQEGDRIQKTATVFSIMDLHKFLNIFVWLRHRARRISILEF